MPTETIATSTLLRPGRYWVGDPCYAFEDHGLWMALLESADYTGPQRILEAEVEIDRYGAVAERGQNEPASLRRFTASGTAHGDGCFLDQYGYEYGVDAGLIGVVPAHDHGPAPRGMNAVYFDKPFQVHYDNGTIHIGGLRIDTDPCYECDCGEPVQHEGDLCYVCESGSDE